MLRRETASLPCSGLNPLLASIKKSDVNYRYLLHDQYLFYPHKKYSSEIHPFDATKSNLLVFIAHA